MKSEKEVKRALEALKDRAVIDSNEDVLFAMMLYVGVLGWVLDEPELAGPSAQFDRTIAASEELMAAFKRAQKAKRN